MQTVVVNNRSCIIIGQLPHHREVVKDPATGKDKPGKVSLNGDAITFFPGVNLVDTKVLKTLRENPGFELNFVAVIRPSKAPEAQSELVRAGRTFLVDLKKELPDERPWSKVDARELEEVIIPEMEMISGAPGARPRSDTLEGFLSEEGRDSVRAAIRARIEAVRPQPKV